MMFHRAFETDIN